MQTLPEFLASVKAQGQPSRVLIRQIRSGLCAVDVEFSGQTLTHQCGRIGAKLIANRIAKETGAPLFNVKKGRNGFPGAVVPCEIDGPQRSPNKA